ncbi:MAG: hypothetical protein AB1779_00895 [Candidatus Thermoplasmatota archaeon]
MSEDIVIVEREKPRRHRYYRAMPATAKDPTIAQIIQRLRFAEMAHRSKGSKRITELPPAAEYVKLLKDITTGMAVRKLRKWGEVLISEIRKQIPEKEEQERLIKIIEEVAHD